MPLPTQVRLTSRSDKLMYFLVQITRYGTMSKRRDWAGRCCTRKTRTLSSKSGTNLKMTLPTQVRLTSRSDKLMYFLVQITRYGTMSKRRDWAARCCTRKTRTLSSKSGTNLKMTLPTQVRHVGQMYSNVFLAQTTRCGTTNKRPDWAERCCAKKTRTLSLKSGTNLKMPLPTQVRLTSRSDVL